jgi:hypothetical protein
VYLKSKPCVATLPTPSILKSSEVVLKSPGLGAVTQFTSVAEAEVTEHCLPSIEIEYLAASVEKPVPENLIVSPPLTVPYLGVIDLSSGV